jgi:hypothetical protein
VPVALYFVSEVAKFLEKSRVMIHMNTSFSTEKYSQILACVLKMSFLCISA